jgi:hypothetical protein
MDSYISLLTFMVKKHSTPTLAPPKKNKKVPPHPSKQNKTYPPCFISTIAKRKIESSLSKPKGRKVSVDKRLEEILELIANE